MAIMAVAFFLVFLSCFICIEAYFLPHIGKITQLPGQPPVDFQQFSGYVNVDKKKEKSLFYYFVEAEIDPASKPLVLWLNGGPGCSSIGVGAFSENGPFTPNAKVLLRNEYSWNREANMLYLDTPVGVGFSYSTGASSYETLGNPLLEFTTDYNSRAEYFWSHGLISDTTYNLFTYGCNYSRYVSEYYRDSVSIVCSKVMSLVNRESSRFVDKYDVTLDVCIPSVLSQSKIIAPQQNSERIDVCVEDETINYLNRLDVQKALHARLVGVRRWDVCSNILDYDMLDLEKPTIPIIGSLVKEGIPVLIYSGDQDSVIPLTGTRTLIHRLAKQLGLNTTVPYRVWFEGQQVGGWTQVYGNILSFATIRGASHEAPFSQPQRSFVLFKSFLDGRPLPQEF
ncbi:hypothetical protein DH2020_018887 [Rehmannia glutinosa]|uniref:Serine carboxypeptidase-like protein n=1 Tax=Rehmannia glutinosa TaxID=99300 RepID=A0ABR0WPM3_REHGL